MDARNTESYALQPVLRPVCRCRGSAEDIRHLRFGRKAFKPKGKRVSSRRNSTFVDEVLEHEHIVEERICPVVAVPHRSLMVDQFGPGHRQGVGQANGPFDRIHVSMGIVAAE